MRGGGLQGRGSGVGRKQVEEADRTLWHFESETQHPGCLPVTCPRTMAPVPELQPTGRGANTKQSPQPQVTRENL